MSLAAGFLSPIKRTKVWWHFLQFAQATPATPSGISHTSRLITRRLFPHE
jgi:hypothetical protein